MKEHEERVEEEQTEACETVQKIEETAEETVKFAEDESATEVTESADTAMEEGIIGEITGDKPLDDDALTQIENLKKHDAASLLVTKTKHIVGDTEKQLNACKLLLEEDLKEYQNAKTALKEHALNESESLMKETGYVNKEEEIEEDTVVFESKEDIPPFCVRDISSGKFSSFLMALIGGGITFAGLVYFAAGKVGVALDPTKIPAKETIEKVLGWYAEFVDGKSDFYLGTGLVAAAVLFVMFLIYIIRVSSRASKNLSFAKQQHEEAREYAKHKSSCKEEMEKVDAHINDAIKMLKTYEVVLNEQNGKLKRILHIEGLKENSDEYHDKSRQEMHDTDMLIKAVKEFMSTPMSEEGRLSGKSTLFLHSAKSKLQKFLDRHY